MARVLLVEDEPNIASIIVFKLKREGHEVRWESGALAVPAAVQALRPDLVLMTEFRDKSVEKRFKPTQVAQLVPATAGHP